MLNITRVLTKIRDKNRRIKEETDMIDMNYK